MSLFKPLSCKDKGFFLAFSVVSGKVSAMVIRMRHTRAHTGNRRSHHALKSPALTKDAKTGAIHLRHRASAVTGMYKGHVAIDMVKKDAKKAKKAKAASAAR